jgi:GAF domain
MRAKSSLDRESFQQLLASAFAVQESQIDSQSLSSIMEVQLLVARGEIDLDGAMHLIVESARGVGNATGVAIGLLKGDQLTYRAGSGSAVADVGRQVRASLTFSANARTSREILRVENARADTRIQAAICRQFGATSLLILPICQDYVLAGVLEVRFSEAHTFDDREVRAYRLMASVIEEGISQAGQAEQKRKQAEMPATPRAVGMIPPQREKSFDDFGVIPGRTNKRPIYQRGGAALAMVRESPVVRRPTLLATTMVHRAKEVSWHKGRNVTLAAVVVALVLACLLAYKGRGPASHLGSSGPPTSAAVEQQVGFQRAKARPGQAAPVSRQEARRAGTAGRRVRVSENEVDYIRGDVTVRYFTYKRPIAQPKRVGESRIAHIGEDVTVRYFATQPGVKATSR